MSESIRSTMRAVVARFIDGPQDRLESTAPRFDASFINALTGVGTSRDKTTYGYAKPFVPLDNETLTRLLHTSDMAERMVSIVPSEMLREGFSIESGDADLDSECAEKFEALALRENLFVAMWGARGYGGSALVMGADDGQDADRPLNLDRVRDLSYVHAVDRRHLSPRAYYDDPEHPKFGRPSVYSVTRQGGNAWSMSDVHESRLVLFRGATTGERERTQLQSWDLSVLQRAHDTLRQFDTGWSALETMLTDSNQSVYKITGLADLVGKPGGQTYIQERVRLIDMARSFIRAIIVDSDSQESFERQSVSFENIPQTMQVLMLRLAAAVQIPVTILMGQSPAGMSATGDSDFRWFFNRVRAEQTLMLAPRIRRMMRIWLQSKASPTKGKLPKSLQVKFPPLWTLDPLQEAQRRKTIAEADGLSVQGQILTPDEVALARFRPGGFDADLVLTKDGIAAREAALKFDLERIAEGERATEEETPGGDGEVVIGEPTSEPQVKETMQLALTASDLAAVTKVNEARANYGLAPLPGADGQLTLPAFKAKYASTIAASAAAESGEDPNDPKPDDFAEKMDATLRRILRFDDGEAKLFVLVRDEDETGVSGTGEVADGVQFGDGTCALRWRTETASTGFYASIEDLLKIHGHDGKSRIEW